MMYFVAARAIKNATCIGRSSQNSWILYGAFLSISSQEMWIHYEKSNPKSRLIPTTCPLPTVFCLRLWSQNINLCSKKHGISTDLVASTAPGWQNPTALKPLAKPAVKSWTRLWMTWYERVYLDHIQRWIVRVFFTKDSKTTFCLLDL